MDQAIKRMRGEPSTKVVLDHLPPGRKHAAFR